MKYFILLSAVLVISQAQRPSYASSGPIGRPGLASRFKEDNPSTTSTTTAVSFENRVGEDGSTTSSTPKIPVDARGDIDLVNTLNSWDREHQPFWFINADHIEKARNTTRGTQQTAQTQNQNVGTTQVVNRNQIDTQGTRGNSQGTQGGIISGTQNRFQGNQGVNQGRPSLSNQDSVLGNQNGMQIGSGNGRQQEGPYHREWPFGRPAQEGFQQNQGFQYVYPKANEHRQFEGTYHRFPNHNRNNQFEFY